MQECLQSPEFFITDFAKFDRPTTLHAGFQALSEYRSQHNRFPRPRNEEDAKALIAISKKFGSDLDEKVLTELAYQSSGDLAPMNAVIGGFVAQEVLESVSAKFHPMLQHMYFDSLESMPASLPSEEDAKPIGSRYDQQIAVFGKSFQDKIANHRQFLVGSGAIGCEMLKNWSMLGLATGPKGVIHVTDLDTIEKSNLNRQFLFRYARLTVHVYFGEIFHESQTEGCRKVKSFGSCGIHHEPRAWRESHSVRRRFEMS